MKEERGIKVQVSTASMLVFFLFYFSFFFLNKKVRSIELVHVYFFQAKQDGRSKSKDDEIKKNEKENRKQKKYNAECK